ncbi:unnamed protein product, partial [Didymodactylos carnosus]
MTNIEEMFQNSETLHISENDPKRKQTGFYIAKKLFWPLLIFLIATFIVLFVLTIYYGVKQGKNGLIDDGASDLHKTITT